MAPGACLRSWCVTTKGGYTGYTDTDETLDHRVQKVQNKVKRLYLKTFKKTKGGMNKKRAACFAIHELLKPDKLIESKFLKINFQIGREDPQALKNQLQKAVKLKTTGELSERSTTAIVKFVDYISNNKMPMDGFESTQEALILGNVSADNYMLMRDTLRELSSAGQIIWETGDRFRVWSRDYNGRRKLEASLLHSYIDKNWWYAKIPRTKRRGANELLPLMYWMEENRDHGQTSARSATGVWVEYTRGIRVKKKIKEPPSWATDYIEQKKLEIKTFLPEDSPNMLPNAVYLLLCRFNGGGVPEESRVQAYAGKATNGVEERWMQHSRISKKLIQSYYELETFNVSPLILGSLMLVDVVIGRLYAQWGRTGLTENDTTAHDNVALFIYNAYGEGKRADMVEKEKDLIRSLKLTDMKYGMNKREG